MMRGTLQLPSPTEPYSRAHICNRLRSSGIDSKESRAGTSNRVGVVGVLARQAGNRFLDSFKGLQLRALASSSTDQLSFLKIKSCLYLLGPRYLLRYARQTQSLEKMFHLKMFNT